MHTRTGTVRYVRWAVTALVLATASCLLAGCTSASTARLHQALQEQLDEFRARTGVPGATAAFVMTDGRSSVAATGVSNKSTQQAMRPTDRMLAGSIGKTYVSAVALQLFEEDRLELETLVADWLGGEQWYARLPNAADITLRMLMNHTSGLPDHVRLPEFTAAIMEQPDRVWRPEELVAYVLDRPPLFPAGQGWSYADTNYILVGMIIERVTGRTFYQELTDRILKPRKLTDTIPSDRNPLPGLINGYTSPQNPFGVAEQVVTDGRCVFNPQMEWTGGGLVSTSLDLARWARHLYAGDVLKKETRTLMLDGVATGPRLGPNTDYGLGVIIRQTAHGPAHGHSGWFPGYVSAMAYYPDHGLAVAVQANSDIGMSTETMNAFLDDLVGWLTAISDLE